MKAWLPFIIAVIGLIIYGVWYWKNKASDFGKYNNDHNQDVDEDYGDLGDFD